jgi:hypothetical protein
MRQSLRVLTAPTVRSSLRMATALAGSHMEPRKNPLLSGTSRIPAPAASRASPIMRRGGLNIVTPAVQSSGNGRVVRLTLRLPISMHFEARHRCLQKEEFLICGSARRRNYPYVLRIN